VKLVKVLVGITLLVLMGLLVATGGHADFTGSRETTIPGKQVMVANYTSHPPTIDGVFHPFEWRGAIPVYVDGSTPATAPGVVPNIPWLPNLRPPDSPEDSSFTIYTLYDENYLYVAVNVTDDIVITDSDLPYLDDDVEVMIDGDRRPGDWAMAICGPPNCQTPVVNNEGFKLTTSARGAIDTSWWSYYFPNSGFRPPQPGDTIGFNVAVGDDDNGGDSYVRSTPAPHSDSFTAWDGRSVGFYIAAEQDWGNLYFAPHSR
jgi:hypothetical protein